MYSKLALMSALVCQIFGNLASTCIVKLTIVREK